MKNIPLSIVKVDNNSFQHLTSENIPKTFFIVFIKVQNKLSKLINTLILSYKI